MAKKRNIPRKKPKAGGKVPVFIQEYLVDFNATQAAIRAGYAKKQAANAGYSLLKKPEIWTEIERLKAERLKKVSVSIDEIVAEYRKLAFFDIRTLYDEHGNFKPIHELDDIAASVIAGVETEELFAGLGEKRKKIGNVSKVKISCRRDALQDLMKHAGGFEKDNAQQAAAGVKAVAAMAQIAGARDAEEKSTIIKDLLK